MDTDFIKQLFDKAILAHSKLQCAQLAAAEFEATATPPTKPSQCTLDEWQVYDNAQVAFATAANALKDAAGRALNEFNVVEQEIIRNVPNGVWFKHDLPLDGQTYGIGISYTNWGGYHYNLQVEPWRDNMPSLDRRHTGD